MGNRVGSRDREGRYGRRVFEATGIGVACSARGRSHFDLMSLIVNDEIYELYPWNKSCFDDIYKLL